MASEFEKKYNYKEPEKVCDECRFVWWAMEGCVCEHKERTRREQGYVFAGGKCDLWEKIK